MTVNRTTLLDLPLPVTGTESGTWGDTTNNGLSQYMDIAIAGMNSLTSANFTAGALTIANTQGDSSATNIAAGSAQYATIKVSSLAVNSTITAPSSNRSYRIINADATYSLTIKASGQTGVTFLPGQTGVVAFNGTDYVIVGVVGAGTATDNAVARFDGTTGEIIQNSVVTIADSTGDVAGVGTLTMGGNLTLNGGTANGVLYLNGSKVATSGSALVFDGSNLGLGVTPSAWSVLKGLDVSSGGALFGFSAQAGITNNAYYNGANWAYKNTGGTAAMYRANGAAHEWFTAPSGTAGNAITFSQVMTLDASGNLGIGTSSPAYKLDVRGGIIVAGNGTIVGGISYSTRPEIGSISNHPCGFITNNTTQMLLDTSGNLGIGTSSPAAKLDVVGSSSRVRWELSTASTYQASSNPAGSAYADARYDALSHSFLLSGGTGAKLDSSGNLGLGATPSAWGLGKAFEIGIAGNCVWGVQNADLRLGANMRYDGSNYRYVNNGLAARYDVANGTLGGHAWFTAPSGTAGNAITFTQAMTLDASGNLLVGQTSGSEAIEVTRSGSTSTGLALSQTGTSGRKYIIASTGTGYGSAGNLIFYDATAAAERARITSGGDLLVGTTDTAPRNLTSGSGARIGPSGQLELAGASDTNYINITAASGTMLEFRKQGPTTVGSISTNGTATAYNTSSDYRLKSNPQLLTGSGAFIDALQPKTWNWKADGSRGVGFIAHEVQEVSPGSVVGEKDGEQMQAMEYGSAEFIANIIAELQSLRQRVALLEGN